MIEVLSKTFWCTSRLVLLLNKVDYLDTFLLHIIQRAGFMTLDIQDATQLFISIYLTFNISIQIMGLYFLNFSLTCHLIYKKMKIKIG